MLEKVSLFEIFMFSLLPFSITVMTLYLDFTMPMKLLALILFAVWEIILFADYFGFTKTKWED